MPPFPEIGVTNNTFIIYRNKYSNYKADNPNCNIKSQNVDKEIALS